jgi:hypothetical protein
MPVQCPACNTYNRDTASFCHKCGHKLLDVETSGSHETASRPSEPPNGDPSVDSEPQMDRSRAFEPRERPVERGNGAGDRPLLQKLLGIVQQIRAWWGRILSEMLLGIVQQILAWWGRGWFLPEKLQGIVQNVREWRPEPGPRRPRLRHVPDGVLDLQRTDEQGQPLGDHQGRALPLTQVEYRYRALRGLPLAEGSQVQIRGKFKRGGLWAKRVKNVTPDHGLALRWGYYVVWGRVTDLSFQPSPYRARCSCRLQLTEPGFAQFLTDARGNWLPVLPAGIPGCELRDGDHVDERKDSLCQIPLCCVVTMRR